MPLDPLVKAFLDRAAAIARDKAASGAAADDQKVEFFAGKSGKGALHTRQGSGSIGAKSRSISPRVRSAPEGEVP